MKVTISAGGKFHAQHLARELLKRHSLHKLFTFDYSSINNVLHKDYVDVITPCRIANTIFENAHLARFFDRRTFNYYKDEWFDFLVARKLEHEKIGDLFVGWSNGCKKSLALARKQQSTVVIESGSPHIRHQINLLEDGKTTTIFNKLIDRIEAEYDLADKITVPSLYAAQTFFEYGFKKSKIILQPLGINTLMFHPTNRIKQKKMHFLFAGLLVKRKGIDFLASIWSQAQLPPDCVLIIAGAAQRETASALKILNRHKNVIHLGGVSQNKLAELYLQSEVFLFPTFDDGFGMVIPEAMASGCCVITTPFSAGPDLIKNEKTGFIKTPTSVDEWSQWLWWAWNNREQVKQIGAAAAIAAKNWTWDDYGSRTYRMYKNILES